MVQAQNSKIIFIAKSSKYMCWGRDACPVFNFLRMGEISAGPYGDIENIGRNAVMFRFSGKFAPIKTRIGIGDDEGVPAFRLGRPFGHRMPEGSRHGFSPDVVQIPGSSPRMTGEASSPAWLFLRQSGGDAAGKS